MMIENRAQLERAGEINTAALNELNEVYINEGNSNPRTTSAQFIAAQPLINDEFQGYIAKDKYSSVTPEKYLQSLQKECQLLLNFSCHTSRFLDCLPGALTITKTQVKAVKRSDGSAINPVIVFQLGEQIHRLLRSYKLPNMTTFEDDIKLVTFSYQDALQVRLYDQQIAANELLLVYDLQLYRVQFSAGTKVTTYIVNLNELSCGLQGKIVLTITLTQEDQHPFHLVRSNLKHFRTLYPQHAYNQNWCAEHAHAQQ